MRNLIGGAVLVLASLAGCGDEYDATPGKSTAGKSGASGSSGSSGSDGSDGGRDDGGDAGSDSTSGAGGAGETGGTAGTGSVPGPASVRGLLRSGGSPLANAVVVVDGKTALTDDNGAYGFDDVPATYQLMVIESDVVNIYDDVTTREPVTNLPDLETPHTASIAGQLSGAGVPVPEGHGTAVSFVASDNALAAHVAVAPGESSYALSNVAWAGSDALEGALQALQWKEGATGPEAYTGFATAPLTIEQGMTHGAADGSVAETNLELTDPEEEQVSGTIAALPSGMDLSAIALFVGRMPVPQTLAPGPFMLVVPTTPLKVALMVTGTNQADSGLSSITLMRPASGVWDLALPPPPKLILPVADAKGITPDVSFSWGELPASVVATITWRVGPLTIRRTTSGTSAKLPDLQPYGLVYEAGLADGWDVQGLGPAATVDEQMVLNDALYAASAPLDVTVLRSASRALQLAE